MSAFAYRGSLEPEPKSCLPLVVTIVVVLGVLLMLAGLALGPIGPGIQRAPESSTLQTVRSIGLMLLYYANDHDGNYPDGKSSTEVFQQLIDGKYATDAAIFYLPLDGKTEPIPGQKLKSENVSFDVTGGLDSSSSDLMPVVFLTDYKVRYTPGGTAVPLAKPFPRFGMMKSGFWGWPMIQYFGEGGIAVSYKNRSAMFIKLDTAGGVITHFISPDYKPDGKTYRQLTPDGVLP